MPLIEAIPDGANMMQSKLITLARGTSAIPYIQIANQTGITLSQGSVLTIKPRTFNIKGNNQAGIEAQGYRYTIIDNRLREYIQTTGGAAQNTNSGDMSQGSTITAISNVATAETVVGTAMTIQATTNNALFSNNLPSLTTSLIIEGINTGARITVPFTVNSTTT